MFFLHTYYKKQILSVKKSTIEDLLSSNRQVNDFMTVKTIITILSINLPLVRHVCLSTCLRSKNIVNCCLKGALHTKKIVLKVVSCLDLHKHTISTIHGDYTVLQHQITYFGDLGPDHVYKWIVTECKF